jgi:cytochrome c553
MQSGVAMRSILLTSLFLLAFAGLAEAQISTDAVIRKCEGCHGPGGNSTSDAVPRLNGQQSQYLNARLFELRDPTRGTGHSIASMFDNATGISDATITAVSRYFASQSPTSADPKGPNAAIGKRIFANGDANGVSSCASCHGADGEGRTATPRLAGQHKAYLVRQIEALMLTARASEPMNHQAYKLDEDQMKALAAYLGNN